MYARAANKTQKMREGRGRPFLVTFVKILGALPERARPSMPVNISDCYAKTTTTTYIEHESSCTDHWKQRTRRKSTGRR